MIGNQQYDYEPLAIWPFVGTVLRPGVGSSFSIVFSIGSTARIKRKDKILNNLYTSQSRENEQIFIFQIKIACLSNENVIV